MVLDVLPEVDNCCLCIDLNVAIIIIGIYGLCWRGPYSAVPLLAGPCANNRSDNVWGYFDLFMAMLVFFAGLTLMLGSILLLIKAFTGAGTTDVFVIAAFALVPISILYYIVVTLLWYYKFNLMCTNPHVNVPNRTAPELILYQIVFLGFEGIWLFYFAICMNSY